MNIGCQLVPISCRLSNLHLNLSATRQINENRGRQAAYVKILQLGIDIYPQIYYYCHPITHAATPPITLHLLIRGITTDIDLNKCINSKLGEAPAVL